jgi:RNA polymerase sigma factor (sigma-70 family)
MSSVENSEKLFLLQVAAGNEQAFRKLVSANKKKLTSFALNMTQSLETAEEVAQDVLLKVWMTRESLIKIENLQTWLFVITRNLSINAMKKALRQKNNLIEWQSQHETLEEGSSAQELLDIVDTAISVLPEQQQTAWLASRRNGLTYTEIAEMMGISKESVKRYISQANAAIMQYALEHKELCIGLVFFLTG